MQKISVTVPRCHFINCRAQVTHTVQRLWTIPGRAPFAQQHCCDQHIPGAKSFYANSLLIQRLTAAAPLGRFYRVERILEGSLR